MKKARLNKVSIPEDIQMIALYSANSIIKQAWSLNHCDLVDFEMLPENYSLHLKQHNVDSLHTIYVSKLLQHFDAWLIENRGSKVLISAIAPAPASFLIIKGDIENQELEYISDFIKLNTCFQHLLLVNKSIIASSTWLSYVELSQPETEEKKKLLKQLNERQTL